MCESIIIVIKLIKRGKKRKKIVAYFKSIGIMTRDTNFEDIKHNRIKLPSLVLIGI